MQWPASNSKDELLVETWTTGLSNRNQNYYPLDRDLQNYSCLTTFRLLRDILKIPNCLMGTR